MRTLLVLAVLALVAGTAILTEIGLNSRNTLDHHPEWFLGKTLMARPPVGFGESRIYRNLLARNRLNLGVFHGFQEVLSVKPLVLERAHFRFRLAEGAYLDVIVGKTGAGFNGVRLGATSFAFRAEPDGGFTSHEPLNLKVGPGWHECDVTPDFLYFDNGDPLPLPGFPPHAGLFGFRGSLANVEVDDVKLNGGPTETFRNDRNAVPVALECFGLLFLPTALIALASRKNRLLRTVAFLLLADLVLGLFWLVDYTVLSSAYLSYYKLEQARLRVVQRLFGGVDPLPAEVKSELSPQEARPSDYRLTAWRDGKNFLFSDSADGVAQYRKEHPQPKLSVLLLGTSQTWGEGAYEMDETLDRYLAEALPPGSEVVNAARRGSNSAELAHRYFDHLYHLKPDRIVVNLGNNDLAAGPLAECLKGFSHLPVLLCLEANSPEEPYLSLKAKHEAMRGTGLPCLDLHAFLARQQGGILWWDKVHLTSYGQKLAARFLADELVTNRSLRERR